MAGKDKKKSAVNDADQKRDLGMSPENDTGLHLNDITQRQEEAINAKGLGNGPKGG